MDNNETLIKHFAQRANTFEINGWTKNDIILSTILNGVNQYCPYAINVLDLGAGTGDVSTYLLNHMSQNVSITALDISNEMLSHIKNNKIKIVVASVNKTPFEDSRFDLIVSRQCLHYVNDLNGTITEIKRILNNNGKFILTQFVPLDNKTKYYWKELTKIRQPLRVHYYSEKDWINCFATNGFSVLSVEHFSIPNSVKKWSHQYNTADLLCTNSYISKILQAPEEYKHDYNIRIVDDDIKGTTFGVTIVFEKTGELSDL